MDKEIEELVDKCIKAYSKKTKLFSYINREKLIERVQSHKSKFSPNKGSFNTYFTTITQHSMIVLYKKEEERIKLAISRNKKINQILND